MTGYRSVRQQAVDAARTILVLVGLVALFWLVASIPSCPEKPVEKPQADRLFVVEAGPEDIGWSQFSLVRHRETGQRFVFVERGGGAVFLVPLGEDQK